MSLRVILFTRSSRPSGAQMARRLSESGWGPAAVIVEKRGKMIGAKKSPLSLLREMGFVFLCKRILEMIQIKFRFILRRMAVIPSPQNDHYLSIEEWALDHPAVPFYEVEDHNDAETQNLLRSLKADVGVLTNTRRIKKEVLEIPVHSFFNLHLSELPKYAGLESIFWALYHGEREIGVTVHRAAEKIDRGAVLLQRRIPVNPVDDEESLYRKGLWLGTFLMVQALKQLGAGTLKEIFQNPEQASYFSWPTVEQRMELKRRRVILKSGRQSEGMTELNDVHIIHFITRMIRGGAQENTLATALSQKGNGDQVTLVTGTDCGKEGELISEALDKGLDVVLLPRLVREIRPFWDFGVFRKFLEILELNPCDIVHTHTSKAGLLGRWAARRKKIPIILHTPHGHIFHSYFAFWKEKLFLRLEQMAASGCDALIALTETERKEHLDLKVGTRGQWHVIPSGVNPAGFSALSPVEQMTFRRSLGIPEAARIVGFVGRLAPVKGARFLAEAIPRIRAGEPSACFILVGDGEERKLLEQRIKENRLSSHVILAGHRTPKEVSQFLSLFDILVIPSLNEGMGRVIVQAGFLAKPVAASRVGGVVDLVEHRETGLLFPSSDSVAIAEAVLELLKNSVLAARLGRQLQKKVLEGFTETQMVGKLNRLYDELLLEKKGKCKEKVLLN